MKCWIRVFLLLALLVDAQYSQAEEIANSIGMKFAFIDSGTFRMGPGGLGHPDEFPHHDVTISNSFWMSITEVTNAQYEQFDPEHRELRGKLGFSKEDNEAVVFVDWNEASRFCEWLSEKEGKPYRLPTETEWEYACRAGTSTRFHTGNDLPAAYHKNQHMSWYPDTLRAASKNTSQHSIVVPLIVGQTPPNAWGLFDMHGNVEEWCYDWYGPYKTGAQTDPVGYVDGDFKVTRGGSHSTDVRYLRSANRIGALPSDKHWLIGFRVVIADLPTTIPHPVPPPPLWARNVKPPLRNAELQKGPDRTTPYFRGPIPYVKHSPYKNNHFGTLVNCPNGDLFAIWNGKSRDGSNRQGVFLASRLRYGGTDWEDCSLFWDTPDRKDSGPALWFDGKDTIMFFCGISVTATSGNLAYITRTSVDSGATWSRARFIKPEHEGLEAPLPNVTRTRDGSLILPCDEAVGSWGGTGLWMSRDGNQWYDPAAGQGAPEEDSMTGPWMAGIHAGLVELKDGSLMGIGRGHAIKDSDGKPYAPKSVSKDGGRGWTYSSSGFPTLGGGQRPVLKRMKEGPILLVSFSKWHSPIRAPGPDGEKDRIGMFAALSFDEGETWPCKRLLTAWKPGEHGREVNAGGNTGTFTMDATHACPGGYIDAKQTLNGLVHLLTSNNHYVFNLAWILECYPEYQHLVDSM